MQTIYANDYIINSESNPKQTINAFGNSIGRPLTGGGIFITNYLNNSFPSSVYNNTFCIQNAPANWQSIYIKAYVPGSTVTNNTLSCATVPNVPPSANAGADISITLPTNSAVLAGFGTDVDGTIVAHQWVKIAGPTAGVLTNANAATANLSALVQGTYRYQLTVTDNLGAIGMDTVQVVVNAPVNIPPVANAGNNVSITLPVNTVTFNGSGTDTDGTIASYAWAKISGPAAGTLSNANAPNAVVNGLQAGLYQYQLTVTDNNGATGKDTVEVLVLPAPNAVPTVNAGNDVTITLPLNTADLTGTATDPDGNIVSYVWTKVSGPAAGTLINANTVSATAQGLEQGVYQFRLTVTDNEGASSSDTVNITVNPAPNLSPTANAGNDIEIVLPNTTATLNGSGTDPDGTIVAYMWAKVSGPAGATLTNNNAANTTITGLTEGVYEYRLMVTDNAGATANDTIRITVLPAEGNIAPSANGGNDIVLSLPTNTTDLTGSGIDVDGTIVSYTWAEIEGPSTGTLATNNTATVTTTGLVQGVYQYELTVTDNEGATGKDTVLVTVNPANNVAPIANAGNNITITLPTNSTTLNGSGSDTDGTIESYSWAKIAGPAAGELLNANQAIAQLNALVQGIYQYELTVTDNAGAIGKDTVQVTVNVAPNLAPIANAGPDITITLPTNSTTLNGSGIDNDGTIVSYLWTKIAGPATGTLTNANSATASLSGLVQGIYQYRLRVTDNSGATASDTVRVTVNQAPNVLPVANAGADITITLPLNTATLNGTGTDSDGTIVSYTWAKIAGPAAGTISNANTATATLSAIVVGVYRYQLTVTDNRGGVGKDTMQLTVNPAPNIPPTANAGPDRVITLPVNTTTLLGSGVDPDGSIASYAWIKISGPLSGTINNPAAQSPVLNGLSQGEYQYQLTVTDNSGATDKDTVRVTVNSPVNIPPTAHAGIDITITLPVNSATLDGSGEDPDGNIVAYSWVKISGPATGSIVNPNAAVATATGLVPGTYRYQLTVTDDAGATGKDTMQVLVNPPVNIPPVANAGSNITLTLPVNSTTLNGSGTDTDGTITAYQWIKISGPTAGTLTNATSAVANLSGLVQGVYQYRLRVTDNAGATASDTVQVTVNAAANIPPVANAGANITLTLPTNSTTLNGSGTDPDGTITAYQWIKISGPAAGVLSNANSATANVSSLVLGVYEYQLTVTDNRGGTAKDTVRVTVHPASNIAPTANAGADITLTLPVNTTVLSGSGIDTDGTIVSFAWIKIGGPSAGTLTNATTATPTANGLVQGTYQYQLTVTDNEGAIGKDTVRVIVNPAPNVPPVANAGNDIVITLPLNTVTLNGSGIDNDGTIVSYAWAKISGPSAGTVSTANAAVTNVTGLVEGIYQFRLTVTDNNGAIHSDVVRVTVNAAPNIPPVADAGVNVNITLPPNSATITGTGTDVDGVIVSYLWEKISGPAGGNLVAPNAATTAITDLVFGVYEFKLTVTDDDGAIGVDTMLLTVGEGRKDNDEILLNVYPNPVVSNLSTQIITSVTTGTATLTLHDNRGEQLLIKRIPLTGAGIIDLIDMTVYAKGTYHIRVSINGKLKTTKTIVKAN